MGQFSSRNKKLRNALYAVKCILQADLLHFGTKKINGKNGVRGARYWRRVNYLKFVFEGKFMILRD